MKNLKITIEYDGTDFAGWQVQPERRTVQGELLRALCELASGEVKLVGAGRTDAGVHAVGQVASALLETRHGTETIHRALGAKLPPDILVRRVEEAHPSFNARYDARSRTYHYLFIRRPTALWRNRFFPVPADIDVSAMRRAAAGLVGEADCTRFSTRNGERGSGLCRIMESAVIEADRIIVYRIRADRFLYHMVQRIAGALLEIGRGRGGHVGGMLEPGDGPTGALLPPFGLYLMKVDY